MAKKQLMDRYDCDEIGELKEYIRCKIDRGNRWMKPTQPVLLQSFEDEFQMSEGKPLNTPAIPGEVLRSRMETSLMSGEMQTKYRSGTGKLLHLMK